MTCRVSLCLLLLKTGMREGLGDDLTCLAVGLLLRWILVTLPCFGTGMHDGLGSIADGLGSVVF